MAVLQNEPPTSQPGLKFELKWPSRVHYAYSNAFRVGYANEFQRCQAVKLSKLIKKPVRRARSVGRFNIFRHLLLPSH